jgi:xanthine dehydrogenase YagR molybdenum-binding subunit
VHTTDLKEGRAGAYTPPPRELIPPVPKPRGQAEQAFANAAVQVDAEYLVPVEHHNPMEPFATTVVRDEDGRLTVYDKTQGVQNVRDYLCHVFGVPKDDLRVVSPFVGGAFGLGLRPQYPVFLAVLAARELKRSVRVTLTRQQMFSLGHRPAAWQRVALGAAPDGTLDAVIHEAIAETSRFEDYSEPVVQWSGLLYRCDHVTLGHRVVQLDLNTPCDMRAPGAAWGLYALECAMDELAAKAGIDPVELRLKNYAERDQNEDKPFSSKALRACYRQGAERFGWARRNPEPRSMREGDTLIGWGMAGGVWDAWQLPAAAKAVLTADGKLTVSSATADIGTGTYTIMTQIAAETLGLPIEDVTFMLGDSSLSNAPVEGGSFTAASVGSAVKAVCQEVGGKLFQLARQLDDSPFADAELADVTFTGGHLRLNRDPSRAVSLTEVLRQGALDAIEEETSAGPSPERAHYSTYSHSAVFAEVKVDQDLGMIHVTRVVSAVAGGRILNPKTARSQVLGGVVWGIGMALEEESVIDHTIGRFVNHNLAEYHVPVNADVHDIEVIFVEEHDAVVNPLGAKGLGEPGIVGVAAAVANAVFHATGKRVRDLPITLDKLL